MAHHHGHSHHHDHGHGSTGNIRTAFFLNFFFTLLEIVGGLWTNSMAILSDALHDLGDSLTLGIAWYLERYSQRGPDEKFTLAMHAFPCWGAAQQPDPHRRFCTDSHQCYSPALQPSARKHPGHAALALLGIGINGLAVLRLRKGKSLNERVVLWHLMEDVLGWVVILIAGIVLLFVDAPILDPILSIVITIYVLTMCSAI